MAAALAFLALAATLSAAAPPGSWENIRRVDEIGTSYMELTQTISADGLELMFMRAPGNVFTLYLATREDRSELFSDLTNCPEINTLPVGHIGPSFSGDGLTLYYTWAEWGLGRMQLKTATRDAHGECFTSPSYLDEINQHPLVRGLLVCMPSISADGLELYFVAGGAMSTGSFDLYVARRSDADEPFGDDVRPLDEINLPGVDDYCPSISADGLTLFFSDADAPYRSGGSTPNIWFATRPDRDSPFGDVTSVGLPASPGVGYRAPAISQDWPAAGSELYFARCSPAVDYACDIYVATWQSGEVLFRRGDANDDGNADISDAVFILAWLYLGGGTPGCMAAVDTNGEGITDLSDAVYLLGHLFLGGLPPPAPFAECGPGSLATDETLGCETTSCAQR